MRGCWKKTKRCYMQKRALQCKRPFLVGGCYISFWVQTGCVRLKNALDRLICISYNEAVLEEALHLFSLSMYNLIREDSALLNHIFENKMQLCLKERL